MASKVRGSGEQSDLRRRAAPHRFESLESLTRLIVLGAPVFYTLGRVFSEGYWSTLGVSSGLMKGSAEDYVYFGFIVIVNGLTLMLPGSHDTAWWIAPLASFALLGGLAFVIWLLTKAKIWITPKLQRFTVRARRFLSRRRPAVRAFSTASSMMSALCAMLLVFFTIAGALLLPLVIAHSIGKFRAEQVRSDLHAGKGGYVQVVSTAVGEAPVRLLECAEQYCVLYTETQLIPVERATVRWIVDTSIDKQGAP